MLWADVIGGCYRRDVIGVEDRTIEPWAAEFPASWLVGSFRWTAGELNPGQRVLGDAVRAARGIRRTRFRVPHPPSIYATTAVFVHGGDEENGGWFGWFEWWGWLGGNRGGKLQHPDFASPSVFHLPLLRPPPCSHTEVMRKTGGGWSRAGQGEAGTRQGRGGARAVRATASRQR